MVIHTMAACPHSCLLGPPLRPRLGCSCLALVLVRLDSVDCSVVCVGGGGVPPFFIKENPESEIQAKCFADTCEKRSEILAKMFAAFFAL